MKNLRMILGVTFGSLYALAGAYYFIDAIRCSPEWMCGLEAQLLSTPWWMIFTSTLQSNLFVVGVGLIVNTSLMFCVGYGIGSLVIKILHHEG